MWSCPIRLNPSRDPPVVTTRVALSHTDMALAWRVHPLTPTVWRFTRSKLWRRLPCCAWLQTLLVYPLQELLAFSQPLTEFIFVA
ncbi:hypothetical protein KPB2_5352 [Klebsiella pneumoniae Kb677]|nr:hypothetical protein KPB2_5352 [Klebsiella pneumoniae Kb677]